MIIIVDYQAGNLTSVCLALEHLGAACEITRDPGRLNEAERVIFPGVGAAGQAMAHLREMGWVEPLREAVARGVPMLGICLGSQIVYERSDEDGGVECLGLLPGRVPRFEPDGPMCKIPQMGWNAVAIRRPHPLMDGIEDRSEFYFVHSYYPAPDDPAIVVGETDYAGVSFASAVGRGNLFATQFHPERSGRIGLRLLENFTKWDGKERE